MVLRASVIADITEITRSNYSAQTYKPHANAILLQFRIRFGQVMVRVLFLLRCCRVKELVYKGHSVVLKNGKRMKILPIIQEREFLLTLITLFVNIGCRDTNNCLEKVMKISHFNQTK